MNYYEHHLGDYLRDTVHLTMLEDGAYRRLLDAYYIKECALPKALRDICRLVRAASKPERDAVHTVLTEFFDDTPEGWRQRRCDAEIRRFKDKAPDREARRENERDRQRRTRERRKQLFNDLREHGIVPAYDASMAELQSIAKRLSAPELSLDENVTNTATTAPPPVTRDAPASHSPVTSHQNPDKEIENTHAPVYQAHVSPAAEVCIALKHTGIGHVNPGDPRLLALLARGATVSNFVAAATGASDKRNPFAYLLATVEGQLTEAASIAARPRAAIHPRAHSRAEARAATIAGLTGKTIQGDDFADRTSIVEMPVDVE